MAELEIWRLLCRRCLGVFSRGLYPCRSRTVSLVNHRLPILCNSVVASRIGASMLLCRPLCRFTLFCSATRFLLENLQLGCALALAAPRILDRNLRCPEPCRAGQTPQVGCGTSHTLSLDRPRILSQ